MTRPQPKAARKQVHSLLSTLSLIRILNCVSHTPRQSAEIAKRLRANGTTADTTSQNRTLQRLRRNNWLVAKNSTYSLTSEGRKALEFARSGLKDLVYLTRRR